MLFQDLLASFLPPQIPQLVFMSISTFVSGQKTQTKKKKKKE